MIKHILILNLILALFYPTVGFSWWKLWDKETEWGNEPPFPHPINRELSEIRESGCDVSNNDSFKLYGETAYMRNEIDSAWMTAENRTILAAATLSQSETTTRMLLRPLLNNEDARLQKASLLTLVFWIFKNQKNSDSTLSELKILLNNPLLNGISDKHYLTAVIHSQSSNWKDVSSELHKAVNIAPLYYNAQVLLAIDNFRKLPLRRLGCDGAFSEIQRYLIPIMALGACPTHVAHLDLAIDRHLPKLKGTGAVRNSIIRKTLLSYVSRNAVECRNKLNQLNHEPSFGCNISFDCENGSLHGR